MVTKLGKLSAPKPMQSFLFLARSLALGAFQTSSMVSTSLSLSVLLLAPSVSVKSTSSATVAILNSVTAKNAGLWVKPLTDTVRSLVMKLFQVSRGFFVTK